MNPITFLRRKYPYLLGFGIIEAMLYYFNGPVGNFTTGFAGLFVIWMFYVWMYRERPAEKSEPCP